MKIAIIGGAGFIGSQITKAYLDAGHDVLVIDSLLYGSHQIIDPRSRFYHVDIRDRKLRTILQQERPHLVSHHAVQQQSNIPGEQPLMVADVHIRGLLNVLDSCVNACVNRIIFASGGNSLYGHIDAERLPIKEETPLCPQSALDISQAAGEWYVRYYTQQHGLKHTVLRYADVFGEEDTIHPAYLRHPLNYIVDMLAEQHRPIIRGTGNEIRDLIFIDDVVQANLCALRLGENQTLHISSGRGHTLNQLYQTIARLMESQLEPIFLSGPLTETIYQPRALIESTYQPEPQIESSAIVLDNIQARRTLGWQPAVSLPDGIRRAVQRSLARREVKEKPRKQISISSKDHSSLEALTMS